MPTAEEIRTVALDHFLVDGYRGTSLADIAEELGTSKANLLYHFASKEALLDAALSPALEEIDAAIDGLGAAGDGGSGADGAADFVERFVDLLIRHRREVHLVMNQSASLRDMALMQRADAAIARLIQAFGIHDHAPERRVRIGVALAGAAYLLTAGRHLDPSGRSVEDDREPLIALMRELIDPAPAVAAPASAPVPAP